ncbi:MAG: hypothetical protein IKQ71_00040 [Lachnospiraceae bacterium]|nr:hypothetical protein [Lachnospiraceae bacterium]
MTMLIILLAFGLRFILRKQSKISVNVLWVIVLVRFILPFNVPLVEISLPTFFDHFVPLSESGVNSNNSYRTDDVKTDSRVTNNSESLGFDSAESKNISINEISRDKEIISSLDDNDEPVNAKGVEETDHKLLSAPEPMEILAILWVVGLILSALYGAFQRYMIFIKQKNATYLQDNIYEWTDKSGACVIGLFNPKVYIPKGISEDEKAVILHHELMHLKRKDNIFLFLFYVALVINWFNPLAWICYFIFQNDIEMACDEQVLKNSDVDEKIFYASTLLKLCTGRKIELFSGVSFGKGNLKRRIKHIGRNYKNNKAVVDIAWLFLLGCATFVGCTGVKNTAKHIDQSQVERYVSKPIDAEMPRLIYADDKKLIISDVVGVMVYDIESKGFISAMFWEDHKEDGYFSDDEDIFSLLGNWAYSDKTGEHVYFEDQRDEIGGVIPQGEPKYFCFDVASGEFGPLYEKPEAERFAVGMEGPVRVLKLKNGYIYPWQTAILDDGTLMFWGIEDKKDSDSRDRTDIVYADSKDKQIHHLFDPSKEKEADESVVCDIPEIIDGTINNEVFSMDSSEVIDKNVIMDVGIVPSDTKNHISFYDRKKGVLIASINWYDVNSLEEYMGDFHLAKENPSFSDVYQAYIEEKGFDGEVGCLIMNDEQTGGWCLELPNDVISDPEAEGDKDRIEKLQNALRDVMSKSFNPKVFGECHALDPMKE